MDIPADGGSEPIIPLPDPDEAGLRANSLEQALAVVQTNAMLEQQPHLLLLLTWVDRAHIAGIGMTKPDAIPAGIHALGQIRLARQDDLAYPQGQVGEAGVGIHQEVVHVLGNRHAASCHGSGLACDGTTGYGHRLWPPAWLVCGASGCGLSSWRRLSAWSSRVIEARPCCQAWSLTPGKRARVHSTSTPSPLGTSRTGIGGPKGAPEGAKYRSRIPRSTSASMRCRTSPPIMGTGATNSPGSPGRTGPAKNSVAQR